MAGSFPGGGLWAVRALGAGASLPAALPRAGFWTSIDAGATWRSGTVPQSLTVDGWVPASTVFALDADHAWAITDGPGSTGFSGAQTDVLSLVASRTTDGGRTWASTPIPGNYAGTDQSLSFVDPLHGFLLITPFRGSLTPGALVRTVDGGQSCRPSRHGRSRA